jgi:MoaA/NifB/PqqE/SkfB family radical SAM enzyme
VGHYEGKNVSLDKEHLDLLNKFYFTLNFKSEYAGYPIVVYHGYHQRTVGCFSAGNRMLYIDSEGYVNACPFCHTKNLNIKDVVATDLNNSSDIKLPGCPTFKTAL